MNHRSADRSESGLALVAMLVLGAILGSMIFVSTSRTRIVTRQQLLHEGQLAARHAAFGGLAAARHALAASPSYVGEELGIGKARVRVRAERAALGGYLVFVDVEVPVFGKLASPIRHRLRATLADVGGLPEVVALASPARE